MTTMKVVGITGGICSGKSTVCGFVREAGHPTIDCDAAAHEAYAQGTACHAAIVREFGAEVTLLGGDGHSAIDRRALGARVFGSSDESKRARARLSAIVWPATAELVRTRLSALAATSTPVVFVEAAVLLDAGWDTVLPCTDVWVAHAPVDVVRARLVKRNGLSQADADARIASQRPPAELLARATRVFNTDKPLEVLKADVLLAISQLSL